ncbi:MAG TPA: tRNA pseudouridine(55) synthase TruB [Gammaproteobacteria bacterium]|nr:tRNA pseudouridine(55) synthase TruB [Gammaproteobacteria bacterium]
MSKQFRHTGLRDVHGVLLLDKPAGLSSNQVLQKVKRLYKAKKAGHTGSLDPLATGLLPICFGEATKISSHLLNADKHYRAAASLGTATATGDAEGEVIRDCNVPVLTSAQVDVVLATFLGEQTQVPPMYSALRHNGQRLYELARAGTEVERQPRPIRISALHLRALSATQMVVDVSCSKGTYIRTLIEDIAAALGTCAHLESLRRTGVDPFRQVDMMTLPELEDEAAEVGVLSRHLLAVDQALPDWPSAHLDAEQSDKITHGQVLDWGEDVSSGWCRLYSNDQRFIGIGQMTEGQLHPRRLMPGLMQD